MAVYTGVPREAWATNDGITPALLNAEVRDPVLALCEWNNWSPTVQQAGSTVSATVTVARYIRAGRLVVARALLSVTGTGTAGNVILVSPPVAPVAPVNTIVGSGLLYLANGGGWRTAVVAPYTTSSWLYFLRTDASLTAGVGIAPSAALASGDSIGFTVIYEGV